MSSVSPEHGGNLRGDNNNFQIRETIIIIINVIISSIIIKLKQFSESLYISIFIISKIYLFFFKGGRKTEQHAQIVLTVVSVVSVAVFIAFCTVFGLLIKGNDSKMSRFYCLKE